VTALYAAMHYPHVFGAVLAESPSLWIAEGRFIGDLWAHRGALPERLFMGCGTKEYSATRDHVR
jgi:enterochelin esterase-like enzyme